MEFLFVSFLMILLFNDLAKVKSANGILVKEDLTGYKPVLKDAINASFQGKHWID